MDPLQPIDFRKSPYARPNQAWVCGWEKDGHPCSLGPNAGGHCRGGSECRPLNRNGRWECTRPDLAGGRCSEGPLPNGECAHAVIPCRPERSWKSRRKFASRWAVATLVGLLLLLIGVGKWHSFIEPGRLTHAHARIGDCSICHGGALGGARGLIAVAFGQSHDKQSDAERCVQCHSLGSNAFTPHGLAPAELTSLTEAAAHPSSDAAVPVMMSMARMAKPRETDKIECGACHREHRGMDIVQTARADAAGRCQVCHAVAFSSLSAGHPEFANYPAKRRTRINFDHAAHLGKYFAEKASQAPPKNCTTCHEPDSRGRLMLVNSFASNCASCHVGDVEGSKLSGARGLAVLQVPGIDLAGLRKRGVAVGDWPELAESKVSPLTDLLLSSDPAYLNVRARLLKADLMDLPDAEYDAEVLVLVWSIKALLNQLQSGGGAEFERRLAGALPKTLSPHQVRELTGRLPAAVIDSAQRAWFPNLEDDLKRHRAGQPTPLVAVRLVAVKPIEAAAPAPAPTASFDSLFGGGGLLGGSDDTAKPKPTGEAAPSRKLLSAEERMPFGGWYRDDDALRYRPSGHADALIRNWLDAPSSPAVFELLADPKKSPGACTKCHSVDSVAGGVAKVNWTPAQADPQMHLATTFSHVKHFSLLGDKGCASCHQLDRKADYQAAFGARDPARFASNFADLRRETCVECHTPKGAGDDCTLCHRYHVGVFTPTLPASALDKTLQASPAR